MYEVRTLDSGRMPYNIQVVSNQILPVTASGINDDFFLFVAVGDGMCAAALRNGLAGSTCAPNSAREE